MTTSPQPSPETPLNSPESPASPIPAAPVTQFAPTKRKPGRPKGTGKPLALKRTYDPDSLAENLATAVIDGKGGIRRSPFLGPVTLDDRKTLARITGEPVEVFNERFAQKLRIVSDKAIDRIEQKLDNDEFKTGELAFVMTSATDKRLALDGSRALQNASVNITVNQFGPHPKDQLLSELDGLSNAKLVSPITVSA